MLNPIQYTEQIVRDFLRYQLTTYPFADQRLHRQMRRLLNLDETRSTPLLRGPFISLSKAFREGVAVLQLAAEGILHPHMPHLAPYPRVRAHQERAVREILSGRTTLIATGTGSGKTEAFLYPIISRCLELRDRDAPPGIVAVLIYPMNALAEDQLERMRFLLAGTGVTFGMYIGKTPNRRGDVTGVRLPHGSSRADYVARQEQLQEAKDNRPVHPFEEKASREEMREPGKQPRILLTNVKQLELLLTRQRDIELFDGATLEFLVVDEAHTFSGTGGAETACLIRRLRAYCGRRPEETVCVATSATIADPSGGDAAGIRFATRFFGVPEDLVSIVREEYDADRWSGNRQVTPPFAGDPEVQLYGVLSVLNAMEVTGPAYSDAPLENLRSTINMLTGRRLDVSRWRESLYETLSANEVVYQLARALESPRALNRLPEDLREAVGRVVPEAEILTWLALGSAARMDDRAFLRPVVHGFVRGIGGAVVTFPAQQAGPRLYLSPEDVGEPDSLFRLPVTTCTTCGQHYFIHHVDNFVFSERRPGGGQAVEGRHIWPARSEANGGSRVVLLDGLVCYDDDDDGAQPGVPRNSAPLFFCRRCGTLHPFAVNRCDGCGDASSLVQLYAVRQKADRPGRLTSCVGCGSTGRQMASAYREPARPVRALTVSDVHVLAQSMVHRAEHPRLLVFTDNRQDAAFQAGWMQDHSRRFRLRSLMFEGLREGPISVGDLTGWLDDQLEADNDLSRALAPEVWRVERKEAAGHRHAVERRRFLRIQVIREVGTGARQRIGLEPWGRLRVDYLGLEPELPFFQAWGSRIRTTPELLRDGVAALLDSARRARMLYDPESRIFSRYWQEGDREVQNGYVPWFDAPPSCFRVSGAANTYVKVWLSEGGRTAAWHAARRWGLTAPDIPTFYEELWRLLTIEIRLLTADILRNSRGNRIPDTDGGVQVDADRLVLRQHRGVYRCTTCRRAHSRRSPHDICMVNRCNGTIVFEDEDRDDYDLMVLDQRFEMVRPREHSAQIPPEDREKLEREFKGTGNRVNTLVCTPTLELGVDIGDLDAVLMRNVPPLPSNYWQRAGRAGRRHRMAVNLTYARTASHDRAYFADPMRLLGGLIEPPSFNLRNDVMLCKHVHAAVLTTLYAAARPGASSDEVREQIRGTLQTCFPQQIKEYLFTPAGEVRRQEFDFQPLQDVIFQHRDLLIEQVREVFAQCWPAEDAEAVSPETLAAYVDGIVEALSQVVGRLRRRLQWALDQLSRLERERSARGTLDAEEDSLRQRCDRLIKKLKGDESRNRREAEGFDETNTYSVLAAEGFLPGYGLDAGFVVGSYHAPRYATDIRDWELRRSTSLALREYVPGNLIYANGHRFIPRYFRLEPVRPLQFHVDFASEAVSEIGTGVSTLGATTLAAIPVCDTDLPHNSHISDEEDYRFQMSVAVYGHELRQHGAGRAFSWGPRSIQLRKAVRLRLVNAGPSSLVANGTLGFPVCTVCGQSRSPLASAHDLREFATHHQQRCGRPVTNVGFFADVIADALSVQGFRDRTEAHSVLEALRKGATQVLEMEQEDLQLLVIGQSGEVSCDGLLYDPMPGGSGLLEQLVERWGEMVSTALEILEGCPSRCADACVDCLMHFRNAWYHRHLNRHVAAQAIRDWGTAITFSHEIPAQLPSMRGVDLTVNEAERTLRDLFDRAGLVGYETQYPIELGRPMGTTTPDFYFRDPDGVDPGICVYLDGMSGHLHGNPQNADRDRHSREQLRSQGYQVVDIPYGHLTDGRAMQGHFFRIGRVLLGRADALRIREDLSWFEQPAAAPTSPWEETFGLVDPNWEPLARALERAGVPPPSEVDWDIVLNGRVSGRRAIFYWAAGDRPFAVVERIENDPLADDASYLRVGEGRPLDVVVEAVRTHFGGTAPGDGR
jgi:ATP-dependent helicase YprA (DUF1998 family)